MKEKRSKKKIVKETRNVAINEATGEVIETIESEVVRVVTSDSFIQIYIEDESSLMKISGKIELQVLVHLWKRAIFDTNEVILIKQVKQEIADSIGTKLQNVNNIINALKKKNIIIAKARGVYYINPEHYFKGYIKNRTKVINRVRKYIIKDNIESDTSIPRKSKQP